MFEKFKSVFGKKKVEPTYLMYDAHCLRDTLKIIVFIVENARRDGVKIQREMLEFADYARHRLPYARAIALKTPNPWETKFYYNIKTDIVYITKFCLNGEDVVQEIEKKEFLNKICIYYNIHGKKMRF